MGVEGGKSCESTARFLNSRFEIVWIMNDDSYAVIIVNRIFIHHTSYRETYEENINDRQIMLMIEKEWWTWKSCLKTTIFDSHVLLFILRDDRSYCIIVNLPLWSVCQPWSGFCRDYSADGLPHSVTRSHDRNRFSQARALWFVGFNDR